MAEPFTIRIFVPDGEPDGVRLIDRMNWTGLCVVFPRSKWQEVRQRAELQRTGVYILVGYAEQDDDLPTIYIGQADAVKTRIENHYSNKDFWNWGVIFVSNSGALNRAHVTWLEHALVKRAVEAHRCHLENGIQPQEPALSEAEKADTKSFLKEIFQILPLVGLQVFEIPKAVANPHAAEASISGGLNVTPKLDTVIVPAQREGFERVFLGNNCWYAIRISGGMISKLKYIAAYQTNPVSAITHYAPVSSIEPYGDGGKYKIIFSTPAKTIGPIPFGDAPSGAMQGPRYTSFTKLMTAKKISELISKI